MNTHNSDYAALILRVSLGIMLIAHALLKVMVFTLPGTVQFFDSLGFPGWLAYVVTAMEFAGGILLIAGIGVRQVSLALVPIMLGALSVHWNNGWVFSAPNGGWEYPAFLAVALFVQSLLGAGAFSLKSVLFNQASMQTSS